MYLLRIRLYAQYDGENFGDFVNEDLLEKKKKNVFLFLLTRNVCSFASLRLKISFRPFYSTYQYF